RLARGEGEVLGDAVDVRVERHEEDARRRVEDPEIDAVVRADHPPEVEVEPLAGAPGARIRHEVRHRPRGRGAAEGVGELGERGLEREVVALEARLERGAERALFGAEARGVPEEARHLRAGPDAVTEGAEPAR